MDSWYFVKQTCIMMIPLSGAIYIWRYVGETHPGGMLNLLFGIN